MSGPAGAGGTPEDEPLPLPLPPPLPLSLEQERMWLFDRLLPASVGYDSPITARLRGALNLTALDAAVGFVIARHDSLRTRFPCRRGVPGQVVDGYVPRRPALVDLGGLTGRERERELATVLARIAARPFDLVTGPLCRVLVVRLGPHDHVLVVGVHHLAADLWSVALLTDELAGGYQRARLGAPPRFPPLHRQAAELGAEQRARLTPRRLDRERRYWRGHLAGASCVPLPSDHPRPRLPGLGSHVHRSSLDPELSQALRRLSLSHGVTAFVLLLAALDALITRWTGHADLVTVSVTAGRRGRAAEQVVGMLTECLILRVSTAGDPSFAELAARVHDAALDALDHSPVPFAEVVALADPGRDLEPSPLRQIGFSLHNTPRPRQFETGLVIEALPETATGKGISEADLWLEVFDDGQGPLLMRLQMDDRLFEPHSVRLTAERFAAVLTAAIRRPDTRLSELPLPGAHDGPATPEAAGSTEDRFEIAGHWVDAGEVEAALTACPGIAEAAVCRRTCRADGGVLVPRVVAFVVADAGSCPPADEITDFAAARLPWYAVPTAIAQAAEIGRRADGAPDRAALPTPTTTVPARDRPPATPTARAVAELVRSILGLPAVNDGDNFFRLGGTSMDAVALSWAIRARLGAEVPLFDIATAPTIAGIAEAADRAGPGA